MQKTKTQQILIFGLAVFGLALFIPGAKAQEGKSILSQLSDSQASISGTANCFDYYKFGSVKVDVSSRSDIATQGATITFHGKVINENDYPIIKGSVYVKIFRKQTDQEKNQANGFFLVDQFTAKDDISLGAKENQEVSFDWKVPVYASNGDYQIATYFISAEKFNLSGLSFTDDIAGNTFNFKVQGNQLGLVEFDKNNVEVNGSEYNFASFIPKFQKDEAVTIKTRLINQTKQAQTIPVSWTLYSWDAQSQKNIIETKRENVQVESNKTKDIQYTVSDNNHPVYFAVAEAQYKDAKSILDIRFARQGIDQVRLNFPAIVKYPLKAGQQNTLFSCVHNSGLSNQVENNKLILTLLDENGKEIHSYTYTGAISGSMMAVKDDFVPKSDYSTFSLKADLYTDNKLVDSAEMKYNCSISDTGICLKKETPASIEAKVAKKRIIPWPILGGLAFFLVSVLVIIIYRKKNSGVSMFILGLLIGMTILFGSTKAASADQVSWQKTRTNDLYFYCDEPLYCGGMGAGWWKQLLDYDLTIYFRAQVKNADTGQIISNGANVPVGTKLTYEFVPENNTDISWFGTGYNMDSPYGYWLSGATRPATGCKASDISLNANNANFYNMFSFDPPVKTISHGSSPLSCDASGLNCTVTSSGLINSNFTFAATYGKIFFDWILKPDDGSGCHRKPALRACPGATGLFCASPGVIEPSAYLINVPEQNIPYTFNAVAGNNPPSVPVITGPVTGKVGTNYSFTVSNGVDPENEGIYYLIDWDSNTVPVESEYLPGAGTIASGTSRNTSHTWGAAGTYKFKAKACDINNNCSGWSADYTIVIDNCVADSACASHAVTWTGTCSGACGGTGNEFGTCDDGCGGTGTKSRSCSTNPCPQNNQWKETAP